MIDSIKQFSEKHFPLLISGIIAIIFMCYFDLKINSIPKFDLILGGTVTISSIIIAFLGTMVSILITLTNTKVMQRINHYDAGPTLTAYISRTIYSGLLLAVYSLVLYPFIELKSNSTSEILFILFAFLTSYFLLSSFRINIITLNILRDVLTDKKEEEDAVSTPQLDPNVWSQDTD
ncbi:hypothetical protein [Terribacillus saccharophilus]|uniref:hypothetical protein n=1 Tax=Terribacillus saccharophilus TaxID=361277 RepID=UPI000C9A62FA|nr:hypothetical protein [Terribacillus goriensis]